MNAKSQSAAPTGGVAGARHGPAYYPWLLALGFGVWASALVIVYVLHSVGCTFGWSTGALRLSLTLTILVHLALIGALWRTYARTGPAPDLGHTDSFLRWVTIGTLVAAFVTTIVTLGPALFLTMCA